eukprot:COSAG02_NODE_1635_length_11556_cov_149.231300_3_plen_155_part_00
MYPRVKQLASSSNVNQTRITCLFRATSKRTKETIQTFGSSSKRRRSRGKIGTHLNRVMKNQMKSSLRLNSNHLMLIWMSPVRRVWLSDQRVSRKRRRARSFEEYSSVPLTSHPGRLHEPVQVAPMLTIVSLVAPFLLHHRDLPQNKRRKQSHLS